MITVNSSGLQPLGRAVLVRAYQPERKQSLIEIPEQAQLQGLLLEQRAEVIAIGSHCWPDEPPRCALGDKVLVSKMAGSMAVGTADGKQYRLVNDRDIFCKITKEQENG